MSQLLEQRRTTVRQYVNEFDKSTVVNISPLDIDEKKPTIKPATYRIPAGTYEKPSILVIGSASWWRDVGPDEPLIEIPQPSPIVAESVVYDYCNGVLGYSRDEKQPGLFWLIGEVKVEELKTKYLKQLNAARDRQIAWYRELINEGDKMWARSNGNPVSITRVMRMAAEELGMERAWLKDFKSVEMTQCKACGALMNPMFPICGNCKAVNNPEKAKGLTFAQ